MDILLVPVHLEALVLSEPKAVHGPLARFERLPWAGSARLFNSDVPWLGPSIEPPPFDPPGTELEPGVHLHWALPDGLTRGSHEEGFPLVPDRWLVHRVAEGALPEARWVVESDWQDPSGRIGPNASLMPRLPQAGLPPWIAQGRALPFAEWTASAETGERAPVTAMGYGDPLFAAYYPTSRGLFGLHDPDAVAGAVHRYHLLGWYSRGDEDALARLLARTGAAALTVEQLRERFHWVLPGREGTDPAPARLVCYASLTITPGPPTASRTPPSVALSNTGTEALAALQAHDATDTERREIEGAAAAIQHASQVLHRDVDHAQALATAAHEHGFVAEPGGHRWSLRRHLDHGEPASADPAHLREDPTPALLADDLDRLNADQRAHDAAQRELAARRTQLLADWSKMLMVLYPATEDRPAPLDPARMRALLEEQGMAEIEVLKARIGTGVPDADEEGHVRTLAPTPAGDSLAGRVAARAGRILHRLDLLNQTGLSGRGLETGGASGRAVFDGKAAALVLDRIEGWGNWPRLGARAPLTAITIWLRLRVDALSEAPILSFDGDAHLALSVEPSGGSCAVAFRLVATDGTAHELVSTTAFSPGDSVDLVAIYDSESGRARMRINRDEAGELLVPGAPPIGTGVRRWGVLGADSAGDSFETAVASGGARFAGEIHRLVVLPDTALSDSDADSLSDRPLPPPLRLAKGTGSRFWRPRDPVVMLKGEAARATSRHSRGELRCHRLDDPVLDGLGGPDRVATKNALKRLSRTLASIVAGGQDDGVRSGTGAPWHPLYMEWETGLKTYAVSPGLEPSSAGYAPDYMTTLFRLEDEGPDLVAGAGAELGTGPPSIASGRAILTPFATRLMAERKESARDAGLDTSRLHPAALAVPDDTQSQALGGFHAALIQHRQATTLPPDDPHALAYGPEEDAERRRAFSGRTIRDAVFPRDPTARSSSGDPHAVTAPELSAASPNQPFLPIRSGRLTLRRLRIVDSFGQSLEVPVDRVACPSGWRDGRPGEGMPLPARLAQAARLNFRWLSADAAVEEAGDHPLRSPICGWIVANYLDHALAIHDAEGHPLGEVIADPVDPWRASPGALPVPPGRFANAALGQIVQALIGQTPARRQAVLQAISGALDHVLPAPGASAAMSLIAGRPLAIVRARLGLELRDGVAFNQSWAAFAEDLRDPSRERDDSGVPQVEFPVRLGEKGRLDDGLVGFWLDDPSGAPKGDFRCPAVSARAGLEGVAGPGDESFDLRLTADGSPRTVTMLIDPMGKVHATSGILPVKDISIPETQFAEALAAIETWTLAAPILTPENALAVPLPAIDGRSWSWLARSGRGWEHRPSGALTAPRMDGAFEGPARLREGWLILSKDR